MESVEQGNIDEPVEPANASRKGETTCPKDGKPEEGQDYNDAMCKVLLLGAFGIGLFAWWSSELCRTALLLWGATAPMSGMVLVCFWLLCLTVLIGILIIAVIKVVRDTERDAGERDETADELLTLQATIERLSDEVFKGSNRSDWAGKH